jgi:hypothetical protein
MADNSTSIPVCDDDRVLATVRDGETLRDVCFSPDGSAVAFIASEGGRRVVQDAKGVRVAYDIAGNLLVGPRGDATVHDAWLGNERMVVRNSKRGGSFKWVGTPVLGPDGGTFAYWAMSPIGPDRRVPMGERYLVVVDDRVAGSYEASGHLVFNPTTGDLVVSVQNRGDAFVMIGGDRGPTFDLVLGACVQPRESSVWYLGKRSNSWSFVRNNQTVDASSSEKVPPSPFFSPDGNHVSYWKCDGSAWTAVVDGVCVGIVDELVAHVQSIAVSTSGEVAYAGHKHGRVYVRIAGEEQGPFDAVGSLVFGPDGKKLAYLARCGEECYLILDGGVVKRFAPILPEEGLLADYLEDRPTFSLDGASLACRAAKGTMQCVICNGEEGPLSVSISGAPTFSPATGSLVYGCSEPRGEFVLVDHVRSEPFERVWSTAINSGDLTIMWQPAFAADGAKVVFGALARGQLLWRALPC